MLSNSNFLSLTFHGFQMYAVFLVLLNCTSMHLAIYKIFIHYIIVITEYHILKRHLWLDYQGYWNNQKLCEPFSSIHLVKLSTVLAGDIYLVFTFLSSKTN